MGKIHELFVLALSLVWFAGVTPEKKSDKSLLGLPVWSPQEFGKGLDKVSSWKMSGLSGPVRDTPPYRAIPFRDSIAEGVSHPFALFS